MEFERWTTLNGAECESEYCNGTCHGELGTCWVRGAVDRLSDYEDIGLSPAQIKSMLNELAVLRAQTTSSQSTTLEITENGIASINDNGTVCLLRSDYTMTLYPNVATYQSMKNK